MTYSFVIDFPDSSYEQFVRANINDWIPNPIESDDEKKQYDWTNYPTVPKDRQGADGTRPDDVYCDRKNILHL